jgi:hypothetical protein
VIVFLLVVVIEFFIVWSSVEQLPFIKKCSRMSARWLPTVVLARFSFISGNILEFHNWLTAFKEDMNGKQNRGNGAASEGVEYEYA